MNNGFFVQHYGPGQIGRFAGSGGSSGESVTFVSRMHKMRTSSDRVCIYDKITKVGSKNCHTFFLLGNGTDTFVGSTTQTENRFSGTVESGEEYPNSWKIHFTSSQRRYQQQNRFMISPDWGALVRLISKREYFTTRPDRRLFIIRNSQTRWR